MEENFDEIEKDMKSTKKTSKKESVDINKIKVKVTAWLMRNGNIKKLIICLVVLFIFGISSIIYCIINNTFYIGYISQILIALLLFRLLIRKINKKFR